MQSEEILENLPKRGKSLNFVRGDAQKMGNFLKKKKIDGNRPIHRLLPSVKNSTFLIFG